MCALPSAAQHDMGLFGPAMKGVEVLIRRAQRDAHADARLKGKFFGKKKVEKFLLGLH